MSEKLERYEQGELSILSEGVFAAVGALVRGTRRVGVSFSHPAEITFSATRQAVVGLTTIVGSSESMTESPTIQLFVYAPLSAPTEADALKRVLDSLRMAFGSWTKDAERPTQRRFGGPFRHGLSVTTAGGEFIAEVYAFRHDGYTVCVALYYAQIHTDLAISWFDAITDSFECPRLVKRGGSTE